MAGPAYVQTAAGPVYTRDGQAFVRDRNGGIKTVSADDAGRLLEESGEFLPVSAEDVAARDVEIARSSLGERAKTLGEAAVAGAVDVPLIAARGLARGGKALVGGDMAPGVEREYDRRVNTLTGRTFVEGAVHDLANPQSEEASAEVEAEYRQAARERAQANPGTVTAGTVLGQLPWAFAGPTAAAARATAGMGAGARIAGQALAGAVEGAALGEAQATDDAYIEDKPLTAEKLMASIGWGALIGGGLGGGLSALGEGAGALRGRVGRGGPGVAREAVTAEEAAAFGAAKREAPTAAATDATGSRLSQAADSAGLNPAARREAAQQEAQRVVAEAKAVDPTDWRNFTKSASKEAQYVHRDTVLNAASSETAADLSGVLERQAPIYQEIDNLQVKRAKIAEHLAKDGVDETAVIGRAQREAAELRARLGELTAQVKERQTQLATEGQMGPVNRGRLKLKRSDAEGVLANMDTIARAHEGQLLAAENGADAIATYDSMRRQLSKVMRQSQGFRPSTYEGTALMDMVRPFSFDEYNRAAANLWDEAFVGKTQAQAQKSVNNARVGAISGDRYDLRPFVTQVGDATGELYGRASHIGNADTIRDMFSKLGDGGGGVRADQFARYIDAQEATLKAIKDNYALSPGNAARVDESLAALQKMRGSVGAATDAANAVNRAKQMIEMDQIAGGYVGKLAASTVLGGVEGGVGGAAKGFARGLLGGAGPTLKLQEALASQGAESKLAAWLEGKIAKVSGTAGKGAGVINQTAANVDQRAGASLDSFFDRVRRGAGQAGIAGKRAVPIGKVAAAPVALKLFLGEDKPADGYRRRVGELIAADRNLGEAVRANTTAALGGLAETAPRTAQHLAVTASRATSYLLNNLPVPTRAPGVINPGYRPVPSELEIAQFAKRWAAVANPLTVLDDFNRGMVTYEQVDALKNVYPSLYQSIRIEALQRFQQLDAEGVPVPYNDRLQADLMFDLNGAGDPTLDPGFALKVSGMMQASSQKNNTPAPGKQPVNLAKNLASPSQSIGATLRGAT